jgi:tripartite-type tricarboxylate transporter receptor subunit TctC
VVAGNLRALAVTGPHRLPQLPNVPTFAEAGVANFDAVSWYSIHVPAGTPKPVIERLNAEVVRVVGLPEIKKAFSAISAEPQSSTPAQLDAYVKAEYQRWSELIHKLNIKAE